VKCGPAAAVKLQKKRMYVSELTMPEIRALSLHYFKTEMSPGVVSDVSAFRMAPLAVTEVDSDGNA
jgi:siroheme synthase